MFLKESMKFVSGDILKVTTDIIVQGCNAQGVMGSGLALAVKKKYPDCFVKYAHRCHLKEVSLGQNVWWSIPDNDNLYIANAITQKYYGRDKDTVYVNYTAIQDCFNDIFDQAAYTKMDVHVPDMIGCGLGGGNRSIVLDIITDSALLNNYDSSNITFWKL